MDENPLSLQTKILGFGLRRSQQRPSPTMWKWRNFLAFSAFIALAFDAASAQLTGNDLDVQGLKDQVENAVDTPKKKDAVEAVRVACNSEDITLTIGLNNDAAYSGLIYPKGLSKNSSCMGDYVQTRESLTYVLPLHSCNTMSTEVVGGVEYFNTIVIQPHRKLVTNKGRGYHIRCRYRTEEKKLLSNFDVGGLLTDQVTATAAMPGSFMRIYSGEPTNGEVAEEVKIGDPLTLVVNIDAQEIYGMQITDCYVKDGLGWTEQKLINEDGCPIDYEILGEFEYSTSKTTALVHFQAHKFPYTSSVYYQCNIKLCIKHAGGCDESPPQCDANGENRLKRRRRRKRQTIELDDADGGLLYDPDREDLKVKVFSGLYVNEATDLDDPVDNDIPEEIHSRAYDPSKICFPQRDFAIAIAIAGLILIVFVVIAILCLLAKRRRRKDLSTTGSSIYSGPYTNTAYSHSS